MSFIDSSDVFTTTKEISFHEFLNLSMISHTLQKVSVTFTEREEK